MLLPCMPVKADDVKLDRLNLDIKIKLPTYTNPKQYEKDFYFNRWNNVPGAVKLELMGVHEMLLNQLRQRTKGQARDVYRFRYDEGGLNWFQYMDKLGEVEEDFPSHGYWWNRPWFYSLPPGKGGAPKSQLIERRGWNMGIPDDFPFLGWCKRKFMSLGDIWIKDQRFNDLDNPNRLDQQNLQTEERNKINYSRLERTPNPNVGFKKEFKMKAKIYRWYESINYHFRFRPSVNIRPDQGMGSIVNDISLRCLMEFFTKRGEHFANLVFFIRQDIPRRQTFLSVALVLVNW